MPASTTSKVTQLRAVASPALLERDDEIAALEAALQAAAGGHGAIVRIEAATGMGKTTLLEIARERAGKLGYLVLDARASAIDRDLPLAVVHALFASLPPGGDEWTRVEGPLRAVASGDRGALLELLQAPVLFSAHRPVLVAIDDLHRADEPSRHFFEHLAFRAHRQRLLVVGTGTAHRGPGAVLSPRALSVEATASIVCAALGSPAPAFCAAVHRLAGGNPRLVQGLVAEARAKGLEPTAEHAWSLDALVPADVAAAVGAQIGLLTATAGELAAALAVLGNGTPVGPAARLAELDAEAAERAADELAAADVLASRRPLAWAQPLLRTAVYDQLPLGSRAVAHRRAVRVLAEAGAPVAVQAEHALTVEPAGDAFLAEVLFRAGGEALSAGAPLRAVRLVERGLAEAPASERRAAAVGLLGSALARLGDARAATLLREALALSPPPHGARMVDDLIDALWLRGDAEAALEVQRETRDEPPAGVAAATAARAGALPAAAIASLAREGLDGTTALERCCALAALIACDELDEASRALAERAEVATASGAHAELAILELLRARSSALAEGGPEPDDRFPGPDPGPSPWNGWQPESIARFGSVTASAAGWSAVGAGASGAERLDALQRAVGLLRESPRPLTLVLALTELGRSLRRAGSRVAARAVLREALDRARRIGAAAVAEQAEAELRIAGARPRRESLSGPESLTAGERRVAEAAAQGLTNREIADSLFLSPKTVEMHLSRSYRKLDIASRGQLMGVLSIAEGDQPCVAP